jgi:hypothetical protein
MKVFDWRGKNWRQRAMLILTIVVVVALASHPELRLFVPIIDTLGLDLLLLVMSVQVIDFIKPLLFATHRYVVVPVVTRSFAVFVFFFGYIGPYVSALILTSYYRRRVTT